MPAACRAQPHSLQSVQTPADNLAADDEFFYRKVMAECFRMGKFTD